MRIKVFYIRNENISSQARCPDKYQFNFDPHTEKNYFRPSPQKSSENLTLTSIITSRLPPQQVMSNSRRQPPVWEWLDLRRYPHPPPTLAHHGIYEPFFFFRLPPRSCYVMEGTRGNPGYHLFYLMHIYSAT